VIPNLRPMLRPLWQTVREAVRRDFAAAGPHALPWLPGAISLA